MGNLFTKRYSLRHESSKPCDRRHEKWTSMDDMQLSNPPPCVGRQLTENNSGIYCSAPIIPTTSSNAPFKSSFNSHRKGENLHLIADQHHAATTSSLSQSVWVTGRSHPSSTSENGTRSSAVSINTLVPTSPYEPGSAYTEDTHQHFYPSIANPDSSRPTHLREPHQTSRSVHNHDYNMGYGHELLHDDPCEEIACMHTGDDFSDHDSSSDTYTKFTSSCEGQKVEEDSYCNIGDLPRNGSNSSLNFERNTSNRSSNVTYCSHQTEDSGAITDISSVSDSYITAFECQRRATEQLPRAPRTRRNHGTAGKCRDEIAETKRRMRKCPGSDIEHMVGAYKETIARVLNVEDVLADLKHIIGETIHDDIFSRVGNTSKKMLVETLLDGIMHSREPGKWQALVDALGRHEYTFLADLLQRRTEQDHFEAREILAIIGPNVCNKLHVNDCLDALYSRNIISEVDKEEVERTDKQRGPIRAIQQLVDMVPRRSADWPAQFAQILKDHGLYKVASLLLFEGEEGSDELDAVRATQPDPMVHRSVSEVETTAPTTESNITIPKRIGHYDQARTFPKQCILPTSRSHYRDHTTDAHTNSHQKSMLESLKILEHSQKLLHEEIKCIRDEQKCQALRHRQSNGDFTEKIGDLENATKKIKQLLEDSSRFHDNGLFPQPPTACSVRAASDSGCVADDKSWSTLSGDSCMLSERL